MKGKSLEPHEFLKLAYEYSLQADRFIKATGGEQGYLELYNAKAMAENAVTVIAERFREKQAARTGEHLG